MSDLLFTREGTAVVVTVEGQCVAEFEDPDKAHRSAIEFLHAAREAQNARRDD